MLSAYSVYRYDHLESPAVTAGPSAILIGTQNGLFPNMGYAMPGEMGGLWAGEKKLCDGFFFAIDDVPLRQSDAYEANPAMGAFHYRMQAEGLHIVRRQFVPEGVSGCVVELTMENLLDVPRMAEVSFTVRTDILTLAAAQAGELGRDVAEYDPQTQAFYARDSLKSWHVVWGADAQSRVLAADLPHEVFGFGGMTGKGINGRLFYRVRLGARGVGTIRLFIAGGYPSRTSAEDALASFRARADTLYEEKERQILAQCREGEATLPDAQLSRCFNWAKFYDAFMTCKVGRDGVLLCRDLTEAPLLLGENWAQAIGGLLAMGCVREAAAMLRTVVSLCESAQVAPGRVPLLLSPDGRVLQSGGVKESAAFIVLSYQALLYTGDSDLASALLPQAALCMRYIRRETKGFQEMPRDWGPLLREAALSWNGLLRAAGMQPEGEDEPPKAEETALPEGASLSQMAVWHGQRDHVEQMTGCLCEMARISKLPGALCGEHESPGVMATSLATAGFVWPMARYLFGIQPDALHKLLTFAPHTPIGWSGWAVSALAIGHAHVSVRSERISYSKVRYTLSIDEEGWSVRVPQTGDQVTRIEGEFSLVMGD